MRRDILIILFSPILACLISSCATHPQPGEVGKYLEKAERAYDTEDWLKAEGAYRELTRLVPQDAYAYFRLGNTLAKQRRLDEAAFFYRESLARDAGLSRAYGNLAMVYLLLAESAIEAAIDKADGNYKFVVTAVKMQQAIRKITNIPVQEIESPMGARGNRAQSKK